jgi:5-methylcytosine-specific restriction endonuclease McrA
MVKDKRKGHKDQKVPASDCRGCRKERKRNTRRARAREQGREYMTRKELAARRADIIEEEKARKRCEADERTEEQRARHEARQAILRVEGREGFTLTREETRRRVERQRERYNTDADYHAAIKAKKIRRKRAMKGAEVEPVKRDRVAKRDGWRCGICGGKVTLEDWSLDHIVPLSQGGSHTYANVTLAHNLCNIRRGVGRLPVQAPLFA